MRKNITITALLLSMTVLLSGCGSDYPVVDRKLDVTELIEKSFEGTGFEIQIEDGNVIVDCVADRMTIDMEKSEKTIKKIQSAVKDATMAGDGLEGVWTGLLDISPIVCENFTDVEGLNLNEYIGGTYITSTLTFTDSGNYMLKFDKQSLEKVSDDLLSKTVKATRDYLEANTTGAGRVIAGTISGNAMENVLVYAVRMVNQMLENGASGTYMAKNGIITFDGESSCSYILNDNILQISNCNTRGVLSSLSAAPSETFTKK